MYSRIEQIRKYIVDNENEFFYCHQANFTEDTGKANSRGNSVVYAWNQRALVVFNRDPKAREIHMCMCIHAYSP